jgi:predicted RNA-binding protein
MYGATVLLTATDGEHVLMRHVMLVRPEGDGLVLASLLGEQKLVRGRIEKIDLLTHRVYVTPRPRGWTSRSKAVRPWTSQARGGWTRCQAGRIWAV